MKYRKRPVEVEAMQWDGSFVHAIAIWSWMRSGLRKPANEFCTLNSDGARILIPTLEGTMTAARGDWIIKGVKGEFYPCKPDIFEATYEPCEVAS